MITRTRLVVALIASVLGAGRAWSQACGDTLAGPVTLSGDLACPSGHGLLLASGATLDCAGHAIRGGGVLGQYGVYLRDVGGATLRNCVVEGFEVGIRLRGATDAVVEDSVARTNLRYGIELTQGAARARVARNQILTNGDEGIHVSGPEDADAAHEIADNVVDGNRLEGIYLLESDANTVRGNTLRNQGAAGIRLKGSDRGLVAENTLAGDSLELIGARQNVLVGNAIVGDRVRLDGAVGNVLSATTVEADAGRPATAYEFLSGAADNTFADAVVAGGVDQHVAASGAAIRNTFVRLTAGPPVRCVVEAGSRVTVTDALGNRVACGDSPGDERLAGDRLLLTAGRSGPARRSLALVARDPALSLGRGAASDDDPTLVGATLRIVGREGEETFPLAATNWRYLGGPGALRGYRYLERSRTGGPITVLLVGGRLLHARGRGYGLPDALATDPSPVGVVLTLGVEGTRYCFAFGGSVSLVPERKLRARNAPAPVTCPP